jgi:uncharacterized membrane protein
METKLNLKVPKIKINKPDWSKWNFRKFNWLTIVSILAYLNILVLIPLLFARKSQFAQYHARQGLALLIFEVVFSFTFYVAVIPWIFAFLTSIMIIVGIINVITGHERRLPLIGNWALQ